MKITNLKLESVDCQTNNKLYSMEIEGAGYLDNGYVEMQLTPCGEILDDEGFPCGGHYEYDCLRSEIEAFALHNG